MSQTSFHERRFGLLATLALAQYLPMILQADAIPPRSAEIAAKQAEKAKHLTSYQPNSVERIVTRVHPQGFENPPVGFYPWLGSIYADGSAAAGPGYRRPYGNNGVFDLHGAWSIKNYKLLDASLHLPEMRAGYFATELTGTYIDAPQVAYYGVGNKTRKADKTAFDYQPMTIGFMEIFRPMSWLSLGGGFQYLEIETKAAKGFRPSIENKFTQTTAPGLGTDPAYTCAHAYAEINWRQPVRYSIKGGSYRFEWTSFNRTGEDRSFDFRRFDIEIKQFFPIRRGNQGIALRGLASTTGVAKGREVPFFLMPMLGGGQEMRGFADYRFRDRHRLLLTSEYRWRPSKFLDMALFYEAGKVASRTRELNLDEMHTCYGIGARIHAPYAIVLRVEVAHSIEGTRLLLCGGDVF